MYLERVRIVLISSFLVLSLLPVIVVSYKVETDGEAAIREGVMSNLVWLVERNEQLITNFLDERLGDVRLVAHALPLHRFDADALKRHFGVMKEQYKVYLRIMFVSAQGRIVSSEDPAPSWEQVRAADWFEGAVSGREHVGKVFLTGDNRPALIIAVPYIGRGGTVLGVMAATIDFRYIDDLIKRVKIGSTGESYLTDRDGFFITSTRFGTRILKDRMPPENIPDHHGASSVREHTDYRGKLVLCAQKEIGTYGWHLLAEQDRDEALAPIYRLRNHIIMLTMVVVLIVMTGAYVASYRIVAALKKSYKRRRSLESQVVQQDKLAAMGLLTAGIAHELNTPLANALIYTQMVKEELDPALSRHMRQLDTVEEEIKLGSAIVRNLLEFSRQSGSEETRCNVNEVMERLLHLAGPQCEACTIQVVKKLQEDMPDAGVDPGSVQQVFMNLVANAVDAMPDGGVLKIVTRFIPALEKIRVDIEDSGPGIPSKYLDRIFDPFYTTKPVGKGTGLGLFVTYGIVRRLGGHMRVMCKGGADEGSASAGGTGTIFTVELPVLEPEVDAEPSERNRTSR